ncbi:DoxX family protein [Echinicola vietnamensis]|uniref:Putative membrane protein n=1 Tax=Echinicola vietnamensis (strain DSM 17526 / LMG 23754 / KMM 6221) TaxID=926556 RepID=L0FWN3_ECHVK|nr:DoxX family protein [Echinicola vietnamensis]AGA77717.1 putative membrane protein [Echinicola vietnamensis DSM 17526]
MKKILFSNSPISRSLALLLLRVGAAALMMTHGWTKIANFSEQLTKFPDPIGVGPAVSLQLTIFAEFFCSILLALGFMTRFALIPLTITMIVAVFIIHSGDPIGNKEVGLLYLATFVSLFFSGPGSISMDAQILKKNRYR